MSESQNIQIPLTLFNKVLDIFNFLNFSNNVMPGFLDFKSVYSALQKKQTRINLHSAYSSVIIANNDKCKKLAYANYLKLKK